MNIYRNSYFKFQIEFFEGWQFRSWSNRKKPPKSVEFYQRSDNDFPVSEKGYKTLFNSACILKQSPSILSCQLSLEVHWRAEDFDLASRLPPKGNEISRKVKNECILGSKSQHLVMEHQCDGYTLTQEIIVWPATSNLWLSACISGDTPLNFESAQRQFRKLKKLDE